MAKVNSWINRESDKGSQVTPNVDPEDSISQLGSATSPVGRSSSKSSESSKSRGSASSKSNSVRLREAKERREQARLKLQQLKLFQDLEQRRIDLRKEEKKLKLMHEYELATVSENIWMIPGDAADSKPDDHDV